MIISMYRMDIPDWVRENMTGLCPHCGCYIVDNSDTGVTTARYCANPVCPGHMSYKISDMADFFHISGFGPATCYRHCVGKKFKSPFEMIPIWFGNEKPLVSLAEIATLLKIDGYGATTATKELSSYWRFEDYFDNLCAVNPLLRPHRETLCAAQDYFTIKPPLSAKKMYVMGTGPFKGFENRDEFFNTINTAYGMYIHVIQTGKRKTGISYLIKEVDAPDRTKSQIAAQYHIPIVTPAEFIGIIQSTCPYIPEE